MMAPAGSEHGRIAGRIFRRLAVHVEKHGLGVTYAAETEFRIAVSPDTVRLVVSLSSGWRHSYVSVGRVLRCRCSLRQLDTRRERCV